MEAQATYFTDIMSSTPIDNSTADVSWAEYRTSDLNIESGNQQSSSYYQIVVRDTDQWLLMSKAYLRVQAVLTADGNGTAIPNSSAGLITMTAGGAAAFERMTLLANDQMIDVCEWPQYTQIVNALMNYSKDKLESVAEGEWLMLDFGKQGLGLKSNAGTYLGVAGPLFDGTAAHVFEHSSGAAIATSVVPATAGANPEAGAIHPFRNDGYAARWNRTRSLAGPVSRLFEFNIPLASVFGFCRDIQSVHRGIKWELTLQKNSRTATMLHGAGAHGAVAENGSAAAQLVLKKISLWVPQITPSLETQAYLEKTLSAGGVSKQFFENMTTRQSDEYPVGTSDFEWLLPLESSKPTRIVFGLQRKPQYNSLNDVSLIDGGGNVGLSDQTHSNPSCFSTLTTYDAASRTVTGGVNEVELRVNNKSLPREKYRLDFSDATPDYARIYTDFLKSTGKYADESGSAVSYKDYKDLYPLFSFDLRDFADVFSGIKQNDIRFRCRVAGGSPDAFRIIAVIYSERELIVQPIGNGLSLRV